MQNDFLESIAEGQGEEKVAGNEKGNVFRFTCQQPTEFRTASDAAMVDLYERTATLFITVYFFLLNDFPFYINFFSLCMVGGGGAFFVAASLLFALLLFDLKQMQS